jgi:uncharacterized protein (TIGR00725 family)
MAREYIIGIMGPGTNATAVDLERAEKLGGLIAEKGGITLTGARPCGVMDAALKGAKNFGGRTFGIIPGKDRSDASSYADVVIATGMGSGRNVINILSCDIVVACGLEAGTASEVALAIKEGKPVIILSDNVAGKDFFQGLAPQLVQVAASVEDAVGAMSKIVGAV